MAVVNKYKCLDCGLDLADDGRVFIWDGESKHTRDFLILMSTYELLDSAQIKGDVDVTYCRECDRYLRIYSIRHVQDGIEEPCELVMQGIENQIEEYGRQLQDLKEIKRKSLYTIERNDDHYEVEFPEWEDFCYTNYHLPNMTKEEVIEDALNDFHHEIDELIEYRQKKYQKYLNSNYLVSDRTDCPEDEDNPLEKVNCPVCDSKIYKHVNHEVPCPRCGGNLMICDIICCD